METTLTYGTTTITELSTSDGEKLETLYNQFFNILYGTQTQVQIPTIAVKNSLYGTTYYKHLLSFMGWSQNLGVYAYKMIINYAEKIVYFHRESNGTWYYKFN